MNIFEEVKRSLHLPDVAEHYGLTVKNSMTNCIFHEDRTPSMKLYDDHFHCFGCQEHGDIIAFTAKLFSLSPIESAEKLARDFGIAHSREPTSIKEKISYYSYVQKEQRALLLLTRYCDFLEECQKQYAPKSMDEPVHPLFIESIKNLEMYKYFRGFFMDASKEERKEFITDRKEFLNGIERKLVTCNSKQQSREVI